MANSTESTPLPQPVSRALQAHEGLRSLAARLQQSQRCLAACQGVLPPALFQQSVAGPWDHEGWTLLCRHPAALAKLRQLKPLIEQALQDAGLSVPQVRLQVLVPGSAL